MTDTSPERAAEEEHFVGKQASDGPLLLDVSRLVWRGWSRRLPTGIDRACLAYVARYRGEALAVIQRGGFTRTVSRFGSRILFDALLSGERIGSRARILYALIVAFWTPSLWRLKGALYLNIGHTGLNRRRHVRWIKRAGVRAVYFLHDLIPITHPHFCREGETATHVARLSAMLKHGIGVVANSADTLGALSAFAAREGLAVPGPRVVAPLGIEDAWLASTHVPAPSAKPYFLTLGTIEGRKNHILLLEIWRAMAQEMGDACPHLVIVGQRGWQCDAAIAMLDTDMTLSGHVAEMPNCSDSELVALMAGANALLFPTHAEGYGIPLVEALAVGTPVIASNLAVFREIAGDAVVYLDPIDVPAWRTQILACAADGTGFQKTQQARLDAAGWRAPTWDAHFALVSPWLRTL